MNQKDGVLYKKGITGIYIHLFAKMQVSTDDARGDPHSPLRDFYETCNMPTKSTTKENETTSHQKVFSFLINFFRISVFNIFFKFTNWRLTKRMEKKLDGY